MKCNVSLWHMFCINVLYHCNKLVFLILTSVVLYGVNKVTRLYEQPPYFTIQFEAPCFEDDPSQKAGNSKNFGDGNITAFQRAG